MQEAEMVKALTKDASRPMAEENLKMEKGRKE